MTIRSFLAFPVSSVLKEQLKPILNDLQATQADVKWVKLENIHLTLKFLGDVKTGDLEGISSVLRERCRSFHPISSYLCGIGAFPDMRHPQIVWAALDDPDKEIQTMVGVLEGDLEKFKIAKESRPFKPHLTLGRVRSSARLKDLWEALQQITIADKTQERLERIILYKSTLTPQGPIYEVLEEFELQKS